jgi:DNA-binding MarR family transcriptional regulator
LITQADRDVAHSVRDMVTRMQRRLRRQAGNPLKLSAAEIDVVYQLTDQENLSPSALCAQLKMSSQFISQVLNRLEQLHYISRTPSLTDKRKTVVALTDIGKKNIEDGRREKEEWLASLIAKHYTAGDKEVIQKALALLSLLPDL